MFGVRDLIWSVVICGVLFALFQVRPAWSARSTLERDARDGFLEAYKGRRQIGGDVIAPRGKGAHLDVMATPVSRRFFEITAQKISWSGSKTEMVARHVVELAAGPGTDETVEVHVALEKRGARWVYTLFEVRDGPALMDLETGNPWSRALKHAVQPDS